MLYPFELLGPTKFVLDRFKSWREYLDDLSAFNAYQMVVVSMTKSMLVMGVLVISLDLLDKTTFHEEREGPIN